MCWPHDPAIATQLTGAALLPRLLQTPAMMAKPIALLALCCLLCGAAMAARPDEGYEIEGKGMIPKS